MADKEKPKTPDAETPFQRMERLARRVVNVPKEEADKHDQHHKKAGQEDEMEPS